MFFGDERVDRRGHDPHVGRVAHLVRARSRLTCQKLASYSWMWGRISASVSGFGVERSMWQRQTHFFAFSGA